MARLRPRALAALLALAAVTLLLAACASGVADTIDAARQLAGEAVSDAEPPRATPVTVESSTGSPEVRTLLVALRDLRVAARGSGIEYDRDDWRHWIDADRDCQNTRAEVLIAESVGPVAFQPEDDGDECRVIAGRWVGPWTGEVFTDASDVDIDHHVPLGHAHESGGWRWNSERKRAYANDLADPVSLQATSRTVNRSKGKQPPDGWRPDESASWCRYAADWITVKQNWELTVTTAEVAALENMLATCDDASSWGLSGAPGR
ncbi:MAG: HNH endonuclease family protein [Chloroflexota bacterium]|nr:HNH endonuclease family protein [Chloroflexota bacterium]MDE2962016.1 HNH endonuclease family protein [Chloroflexota bacterium]